MSLIKSQFEAATEAHRQGALSTAAGLYREVIAADPAHLDALLRLAGLREEDGAWEAAKTLLEQAAALRPEDSEILCRLGRAREELGEHAAAIECLRQAVALEPFLPEPLIGLGMALAADERAEEAERCYREALELDGHAVNAHLNLGCLLARRGDTEAALAPLRRAVELAPSSALAWRELATALADRRRHEEAAEAFDRALALAPDDPVAAFHAGHLHMRRRRPQAALPYYRRAVEAAPDNPDLRNGLAGALQECGETQAALDMVEGVLRERPDMAEAHNVRGNCLNTLRRYDEALDAYREAQRCSPDMSIATYNQGNTLWALGRNDEALAAFQAALAADPQLASAHSGIGIVLQQQGRHEEAVAAFERALELDPRFGDALNNKAISLQTLGRYSEAAAAYYRLVDDFPQRGATYFNLGTLLLLLERWDEAAVVLRQGLAVDPDGPAFYPYLVHAMQQQCDWTNLDAVVERIRANTEAELDQGRSVSLTPFALQSMPGRFSMALRRRVAQSVSDRIARQIGAVDGRVFFQHARRPRRRKLRVGYVSPDFRFHSVAVAFKGILDAHDRDRFVWYGYSLHGGRRDDLHRQFGESFDHFVDIAPLPIDEAARRIHADDIDILVDLAGHTRSVRLEIFAMRPAPIQAHYLGFTSTVGARFLDYLLTDARLAPPDHRPHYTEKLVLLPDSFMAGNRVPVPEERPTRRDEGLPEHGFVFANFNNHYKFDPQMFAVWMRLLRRVPGSVLWVMHGTPKSAENLQREAALRGVDPARLVFARMKRHPQHLARLGLADLALDNLYHGGGVTTLDALWTGVPVLTIAGDALPSRNGASLLPAVGLGELVTESLDDYERAALSLAREPERLAALRRRLAANREHMPLFDVERLTRHIEQAYDLMWQRFEQGLPPAEIEVPPLPADATPVGRRRP